MATIGIDLVHIPSFAEKIKDRLLLRRLFTDEELRDAAGSAETLAGMFAAKEAFFKAVKKVPDWQALHVEHKEGGAPFFSARESASVSISHDGDYAVAVVIVDH